MMLFKIEFFSFFFSFFLRKNGSVEVPRWVPYLLFLKDFWVMTAQLRNRSAVALTQSAVSKNSSYSLCLKRNRDTADTLEFSQG